MDRDHYLSDQWIEEQRVRGLRRGAHTPACAEDAITHTLSSAVQRPAGLNVLDRRVDGLGVPNWMKSDVHYLADALERGLVKICHCLGTPLPTFSSLPISGTYYRSRDCANLPDTFTTLRVEGTPLPL